MLTKKQYDLLLLIDKKLKEEGVPPSFEEMKDAIGLKSKSGIHRLISSLEERCFIRRLPHKARAIEVIRMPENISSSGESKICDNINKNLDTFSLANVNTKSGAITFSATDSGKNTIIKAKQNNQNNQNYNTFDFKTADSLFLPLYGKIAAGTPIEALCDENEFIAVPASMLGNGQHYALTVEGDSMIEAGIFNGDTAIIKKANSSDNGDIVVALIDGYEVTLKKIHMKGPKIELEPANHNYQTQIFNANRVSIQGRLVGLLRNY